MGLSYQGLNIFFLYLITQLNFIQFFFLDHKKHTQFLFLNLVIFCMDIDIIYYWIKGIVCY